MTFIHKHTKENWVLSPQKLEFPLEKAEKCYVRKGHKKAISFLAIVPGFHKEEQKANAKLISQAPKLLEFAEMLYDQWNGMAVKPIFLKELKKTIEAAGVEITE